MAKKKSDQPMPATADQEKTSQARLELPVEQMNMVRAAARRRGLPLTAFIRMAVLEKAEEIMEGRS
jgi:uncharacterized protein (DUF1778 family)